MIPAAPSLIPNPTISRQSAGAVDVKAFICGCGHTGTSILARIMAAHPEVFCPPFETETFKGDPQHAMREFERMLVTAGQKGKRALIEKTPRHIYSIELIRKLVPGAKFIVTVRDGRDVAASLIKREGSAEAGIERWLYETKLSLEQRQRSDVMLVRYEDFVSDPRSVIEKICLFISLRFEPSMLDYYKQPVLWYGQTEIRKGSGASGTEHDALRNWQVNQPIFDGRGIWKGRLSPKQVAVLEAGPGRALMRALGYI